MRREDFFMCQMRIPWNNFRIPWLIQMLKCLVFITLVSVAGLVVFRLALIHTLTLVIGKTP